MLKCKFLILPTLILTALLCFAACRQPKSDSEQVLQSIQSVSDENKKNTQKSDTRMFFGEEYAKRNDIELPKYVNKNIPIGVVKKQEYKPVVPTQKELAEITERLDPILSMFFSDYNCEKDNAYEFLFSYNQLGYVCPKYDDEVAEFIAKPIAINADNNSLFWDIYGIYKKDPLGKFTILDEVYDKSGNVNYNRINELCSDGNIVVIGHNMFSGAYIDWLVEGVWNGMADHETYFEFNDGTLLYFHDGNYYTPKLFGGRGGGIMYLPVLTKTTPLDENKYKLEYYITNDSKPNYYCEATVGMKESDGGFRFWSIYSLDFDVKNNEP